MTAAAFAMGALALGHLEGLKTTPLLTMDEGVQALSQAAGVGYQPPG